MNPAMIEILPDAHAWAQASAHAVQAVLAEGLRARGRAALVGAGGRSPAPVYDLLSAAPIDWARVTVTLSDERCVPPGDPGSNLRLLRSRLCVGPAAAATVLPLWPAPPDAALAALTPFDAVILGMGQDGHIASLFPGSPTLAEGLKPEGGGFTVIMPEGLGSPPVSRISLTITALLQARAIFLLIAGEAKREVIARALAGEDLPVRALLTQDRAPVRILWSPSSEG